MSERIPVGIFGVGMVGTPVRRWFIEEKGYKPGTDLFCFDTDQSKGYHDDVARAAVIFICLPTPPGPDGACDTGIVEKAITGIADGHIVVIKSTVPPGTTSRIQRERPGLKMMFNPEFLTESQAWADFVRPSRQIIGVTGQSLPHALDVLSLLPQAMFRRPDTPIYGPRQIVSSTEAELAKYAGNVFGALKVSFANILADLCHAYGTAHSEAIDYANVRDMVAADLRIGPAWLDAEHGPYNGFGGYCLPKDTAALLAWANAAKTGFISPADTDAIPAMPDHGGVSRASTLQAGISFLKRLYAYNEQLLAEQGLSVADVSDHTAKIDIAAKRRRVRT